MRKYQRLQILGQQQNKAFISKKPFMNNSKGNHKKAVKCCECGKIGHIKRNCYKFINRNKTEKVDNVSDFRNNYAQNEDITLYASNFSMFR